MKVDEEMNGQEPPVMPSWANRGPHTTGGKPSTKWPNVCEHLPITTRCANEKFTILGYSLFYGMLIGSQLVPTKYPG